MSRQGRWRGSGASSQEPPAPRPSSHSKKLTWHVETETSRCAGSVPFLLPLVLLFPFFETSSATAAVAVGAVSISQDGNNMEVGPQHCDCAAS